MVTKINSLENEFLRVVHDYQKIIYKVCRVYRDSKEDQEDLFQEIVYQVWKSYPLFKNASKISSWIYRISLNTAMTVYRKKRPPIQYYEQLPEQVQTVSELTRSEREDRLYAAIKTLNDTEKAVIALFLEDFSYLEIAYITGLSENNIGVRLNRIKTKLKKIII